MNIPKELIEANDGLEIIYHSDKLFYLLGHSAVIGLVLCVITYYSNSYILNTKKDPKKAKLKLILSTSNIMYLCMGLTAIMILVNNNLARAFSIGAAIALVRFRVKLGAKGAAANILFAIIAGIACGLDQEKLAWIMTLVYAFISFGTFFIIKSQGAKAIQDLESQE